MGGPRARPGRRRGSVGRTRRVPGRWSQSGARSRSGARSGAQPPPGRPPSSVGRTDRLRPAQLRGCRALVIAAGQLLPPPLELPVPQPLAPAEVADGQPAALLLSDRPPPEHLSGRIKSLAAALGHAGISTRPVDRLEAIVPRPSRCVWYDAYCPGGAGQYQLVRSCTTADPDRTRPSRLHDGDEQKASCNFARESVFARIRNRSRSQAEGDKRIKGI